MTVTRTLIGFPKTLNCSAIWKANSLKIHENVFPYQTEHILPTSTFMKLRICDLRIFSGSLGWVIGQNLQVTLTRGKRPYHNTIIIISMLYPQYLINCATDVFFYYDIIMHTYQRNTDHWDLLGIFFFIIYSIHIMTLQLWYNAILD